MDGAEEWENGKEIYMFWRETFFFWEGEKYYLKCVLENSVV